MLDIVFTSVFWLVSFGAIGWMLFKYREAQRILDNANPAAHLQDLEARLQIAKDELARASEAQQAIEPLKIEFEQLQLRRQAILDEIAALEGQRQNLILELQRIEPEKQLLEQTRQQVAKAMEELADAKQKQAEALKDTEVMKAVLAGLNESKVKNEQLISQLEARVVELNRQIQTLETQRLEGERNLGSAKHNLESSEKQLSEMRAELAKTQAGREKAYSELKEIEAKVEALRKVIATYETLLKDLQADVGKRTGTVKVEPNKALEDLTQPALNFVFTGAANIDESTALERLGSHLNLKGLKYPSRVQLAFHTSLKASQINPLVVLAGVSGTGKSALPMAYAEALGLNFVSLAVQPGWSGPQDLTGFYNYLESKYKATELSRALAQMSRYSSDDLPGLKLDSRKEQMLLLLLDEMNLARVEYYFSDFLSRLEQRRGRDFENPQRRHEVALPIDIGGMAQGEKLRYLFPDLNVLFVGTMNEDESTQSLSDKVIDRANVLRFGAPKSLHATTAQASAPAKQYLPRKVWDSWVREFDESAHKDEQRSLTEINDQLERINRPFGHRVYRAVLDYIANYPGVGNSAERRANAMADQIEQKIIPKLRGLDNQEDNVVKCLDFLSKKIGDLRDQELKEAFERARQGHMFEWYGVKRS